MDNERLKDQSSLPHDVVLKIEDLSIAFGGLKAVDSLSFHIKERRYLGS